MSPTEIDNLLNRAENAEREIEKLKKEREDFFLWDNQHPIEQVQHMTLKQYASGSLVRVWEYNEIADKLVDIQYERDAAKAEISRVERERDKMAALLRRARPHLSMPTDELSDEINEFLAK